eukprot:768281-Hanusia_phi.AAC.9
MEEAVPLVRPRMKEVEKRRGGGALAALAAASLLVLLVVAADGGSSKSRGVRRTVLAESQAEDAYKELKRVLKEDGGQKLSMQKLQEAAPAADAPAPAPADAAAAPAPAPAAADPPKDGELESFQSIRLHANMNHHLLPSMIVFSHLMLSILPVDHSKF